MKLKSNAIPDARQIRWLIGIKHEYLAILVPSPAEYFSILFKKQK